MLSRGVLLGILVGGVPPGPFFQTKKGHFSLTPFFRPGLLNPYLFSDLASKKLGRHYLD